MSLSIESESIDINPRGGSTIPEARVLLVASSLQSRVRLEAPGGLGEPVDTARPDLLPPDLAAYDVVVLDLDETGTETVEALRAGGFEGRVVGFFSHVNESLGARASTLGVDVFPRGRFWREARAILEDG